MSELKERLDNLRALMQEPEFLEGKGLSNEVNIRIFCYDPSDEMMVRHFIEQIMTDQSMNCHLIEHNLYEVFLSICEDKRIAKTIPAMEEKKGKEFIRDQMSRMANNTAFVNKMKYEPHEAGDVLVITGVGDAFPFIRVHDLLNAMQPEFPDVPILVFYPGNYDGRDVQLFNRLKKNPYYHNKRLYYQLSGFAGYRHDWKAGSSYIDCYVLDCTWKANTQQPCCTW